MDVALLEIYGTLGMDNMHAFAKAAVVFKIDFLELIPSYAKPHLDCCHHAHFYLSLWLVSYGAVSPTSSISLYPHGNGTQGMCVCKF